ncbi:MAG: dynein light chain Tctex-type family protein [archaeon]|nr:dynein light chain Tctex-type family protein [archaeon]
MARKIEQTIDDIKEEFQPLCEDVVKEYLNDKEYNEEEAGNYAKELCQKVIAALTEKNKNIKYFANAILLPKNECAVNIASDCFCDPTTDGCIKYKFEENESLLCMLIVYFLKL